MTAGSTWLGLAGLAIIGVLMHRQVKVTNGPEIATTKPENVNTREQAGYRSSAFFFA